MTSRQRKSRYRQKPRLAVGYHFYNDFDTLPPALELVRRTYDGPVAMATDYMVFNVTKKAIRTRMAAIDEDIWPPPATRPKAAPNAKLRDKEAVMSDFTKSGWERMDDIVRKVYERTNKKYGTSIPYPHK